MSKNSLIVFFKCLLSIKQNLGKLKKQTIQNSRETVLERSVTFKLYLKQLDGD